MSALIDPVAPEVPNATTRSVSGAARVRALAALAILTAMGLLTAASVFAARPYLPAERPGAKQVPATPAAAKAATEPC